MVGSKRQHTLEIWALTFGYFVFYVPYAGLTKAVTGGMLNFGVPIAGIQLLIPSAISTALMVLLFITVMKWWKYARHGRLLGIALPLPDLTTCISGAGFAIIIATTLLAYSFSRVSIILALLLMRGGVLIIAPLIDRIFTRRVRWFSWAGLILSLGALFTAFSNLSGFQIGLGALLNLAGYLAGYSARLPCMTRAAKTGNKSAALRYFVEEQFVAMVILVCGPLLLAWIGQGRIGYELRFGITHFFSSPATVPGLIIGFFYAGLGIFGSFIYLDRRENTFCIPLWSCSSLLSGITAAYLLTALFHFPWPGNQQVAGAILVMAALLVLSPLHHLGEIIQSAFGRKAQTVRMRAETEQSYATAAPAREWQSRHAFQERETRP